MQTHSTSSIRLKVKRHDISYLRWTLESYDGIALVTTIDSGLSAIEVRISPYCENILIEILNYLKKQEGISIEFE
ncbi:MAG: DUF4911 domain-containing protein [Desulfobacteraceae bacterium]|jgi:hypothetical protein|nr:MAG: DUF4911 domain-containing protein [Desulfobacteraceae bacterium]